MATHYERIAEDLQQKIRTGTYPPGSRLPSETELAATYKVGRPTLRHALAVLQTQGIIEKRHGLGNFIRRTYQHIEYANNRPAPATDPETTITLTTHQTVADPETASLLEVPPGTPLIEHTYVTHQAENPPHSLVRSYIPKPILTAIPPISDTPHSPWGDDIREHLTANGIKIDHTTERLTARPPTTEEAETLGLTVGVSVLVIHRKTIDTDGQVVEAATLTLSGNRTQAVYTTPTPQPTG